jgi:hypothetical protein
MPRAGALSREADGRVQDGPPLHLFLLPDERSCGGIGRYMRHLISGGEEALTLCRFNTLSVQHRCGAALLLFEMRHLHPPSPPLQSQPVRHQRIAANIAKLPDLSGGFAIRVMLTPLTSVMSHSNAAYTRLTLRTLIVGWLDLVKRFALKFSIVFYQPNLSNQMLNFNTRE